MIHLSDGWWLAETRAKSIVRVCVCVSAREVIRFTLQFDIEFNGMGWLDRTEKIIEQKK